MNDAIAANPTLASESPMPGAHRLARDQRAASWCSAGGRMRSGIRSATSAPRKGQMAANAQTAS